MVSLFNLQLSPFLLLLGNLGGRGRVLILALRVRMTGRRVTTRNLFRLLFLSVFSEHLLVGGGLLTSLDTALQLVRNATTLSLQSDWRDQALDLWCLRSRLLSFLGGQSSTDHILPHIILLAQIEKSADLGGTLWSKATWNNLVGEALDLIVSLLHHNKSQDGEIGVDDTPTDRLAFALSGSARTIAGMALGEEKTHAAIGDHALLHRKSLLVIPTGDAKHVALPLIAERIRLHLLGHSLLVENAQFLLILHLDELLAAGGGIGDVQLHDGDDH